MKWRRLCRFLVFLAFIFLVNLSAQANTQINYSYYMQIYDNQGNYRPTPEVPVVFFENPLELQIKNGTEKNDRFMLLCVLNGKAQTFSTSTMANVKQASFEICGNETLNIPLKIYLTDIISNAPNILHIISIGLLDRIPLNEHDNISIYSHVISIPLDIKNFFDFSNAIQFDMQNVQFSSDKSPSLEEITFIPESGEIGSSLQIMYHTESRVFMVDVAIYAPDCPMCAMFFLDEQLLQFNGKDSIILNQDINSYLRTKLNLRLTEGDHQLFGIWLPIDNSYPAIFSTSEKIVIHVK